MEMKRQLPLASKARYLFDSEHPRLSEFSYRQDSEVDESLGQLRPKNERALDKVKLPVNLVNRYTLY